MRMIEDDQPPYAELPDSGIRSAALHDDSWLARGFCPRLISDLLFFGKIRQTLVMGENERYRIC